METDTELAIRVLEALGDTRCHLSPSSDGFFPLAEGNTWCVTECRETNCNLPHFRFRRSEVRTTYGGGFYSLATKDLKPCP